MACSTMQRTATHCNTLQRTATHCNTMQHTATHCNALQRTAWAAAVQTPGGAAGQFAAHQTLLVTLRAQQAGTAGGGAAVVSAPVTGSSANEASSFGPAVDQGYKSLVVEMREERQVHPNMESVFRRKYYGYSAAHVFLPRSACVSCDF